MITIKLDNNDIIFKHKLSELTMKEFDDIIKILFKNGEDDDNDIYIYLDIISYLSGVKKDIIEELPYSDFIKICVSMFNELPDANYCKEFTRNDITYKEKIKDSVRFTKKLENLFVYEEDKFSSIIAFVFNCDKSIIQDMMLSDFIINITNYSDLFAQYLKQLTNTNETTTTERNIIIE